ncbi:DUF397 domain-containing protein [Planomonospora venezuelensis]|uniref:DUF397 domain-containing protein n=1 Tax=Planomonospora venezuelensis TaxID=1999 RepID=A0A841CZ41_PLAVE|nr:DUF397 domain-containing protein [Planomonospora venezuelensis]MBB5961215.1 hypothetical protein [Planomonospora venezuelensis]GIM99888.1 hypothetical protein Pve01_15470 [Planomonospora venezuelensis]
MEAVTSPKIVWRKSSLSALANECVETGRTADGRVAIRDSKDPKGTILVFGAKEWGKFIETVKKGNVFSV